MRTNEELLSAVHARAEARARVRRRRRIALMGSGAAACALALIVLMARAMPALHERAVPGGEGALLQGSILADSGALGYAVVGIVAFLLGVAVTLFCVLLKRRRDGEEERHDRER